MDIEEAIVEATVDIFTSMVMLEITPGEPLPSVGRPKPLKSSLTGIVGFTGTYSGVLAIHTPYGVAKSITESFLGMEVGAINEDVQDSIGELTNMLAGNIKPFLSDNGKDINLSIPSTVYGDEYTFLVAEGVEQRVIVPFTLKEKTFLVELHFKKGL